jgi:hypothetical protein
MELSLSELTLNPFNSIYLNLAEFAAVNNLVSMVTMEHNPNPQFSKADLKTMNLNHFKMTEATRLKIISSRSP